MNSNWKNWLDEKLKDISDKEKATNINIQCVLYPSSSKNSLGQELQFCQLICIIKGASFPKISKTYKKDFNILPCDDAKKLMNKIREYVKRYLLSKGYKISLSQSYKRKFNDNYHYFK